MTAPRGSDSAPATRTPRELLLLPYVVILIARRPDARLGAALEHRATSACISRRHACSSGLSPIATSRSSTRRWRWSRWPSPISPGRSARLRSRSTSGCSRAGRRSSSWRSDSCVGRVRAWATPAQRLATSAGPAPPRRLRLFLLSIGAALALAFRFDLLPALLATVALWGALANRPTLAGVAVALGILAKLYPLAIVPALAIPWLMPFDLVAWSGTGARGHGHGGGSGRSGARRQRDLCVPALPGRRGLQIESVGGGLAVLLGLVGGTHRTCPSGSAPCRSRGSARSARCAIATSGVIGFASLRVARVAAGPSGGRGCRRWSPVGDGRPGYHRGPCSS